jgi:hypothetical protein
MVVLASSTRSGPKITFPPGSIQLSGVSSLAQGLGTPSAWCGADPRIGEVRRRFLRNSPHGTW